MQFKPYKPNKPRGDQRITPWAPKRPRSYATPPKPDIYLPQVGKAPHPFKEMALKPPKFALDKH